MARAPQSLTFIATVVGVLSATEPAWAEESTSEQSKAEAGEAASQDDAEILFRQGRDLMNEGRLQEACLALKRSLELERGIGTLLNLAKCYELQGKPATAWNFYRQSAELADSTSDEKRKALAQEQQARIAPRIPDVLITIDGLTAETALTLDDEPLSTDKVGAAMPIDPGPHVLVVTQGKESRTINFRVHRRKPGEPSKARVHVSALPKDETNGALATPAATPVTKESSALHWVGLGTLGTGLVLSGVGVALGFDAKARESRADCDENDFCTDRGLQQRDEAKNQLTTGYVLGVAGAAVAIAGGITLVVAGAQENKTHRALQAQLLAGSTLGLRLKGTF